MQAAGEFHLYTFDHDADPIIANANAIETVRICQFLQIGDVAEFFRRLDIFDGLLNLVQHAAVLDFP